MCRACNFEETLGNSTMISCACDFDCGAGPHFKLTFRSRIVPAKRVMYMLCVTTLVGGLLLLYDRASTVKPAYPIGKVVQIPTPLGLPPVPISPDNPPTKETIALGRRLFYDQRMSVNGKQSCSAAINNSWLLQMDEPAPREQPASCILGVA